MEVFAERVFWTRRRVPEALLMVIGCRQKEFGDLTASCYSFANVKIEQAPAAAARSSRGANGQASERPRFRPKAVGSGCAGCGTSAGAEPVPARQAEAQEGRASAGSRYNDGVSGAVSSGTPEPPSGLRPGDHGPARERCGTTAQAPSARAQGPATGQSPAASHLRQDRPCLSRAQAASGTADAAGA